MGKEDEMKKIRDFLNSRWFSCFVFALACAVVVLKEEVLGVIIFVNLIAVLLLISDFTPVMMLPLLLMCAFVTKCYDSFSVFAPLWPYAIFPAAALLFHFIFYRRKLSVGESFCGIVAVAVAVTLGGVCKISAEEYFSPSALYYVVGLGVGMALLYLLLRPKFCGRYSQQAKKTFMFAMYSFGTFCCFMLAEYYISNYDTTVAVGKLANIQWSNNISTMLMFAMPIPLYFCRKNPLHLLSVIIMCAATVATGSRGGLVCGTLEFAVCILYFAFMEKKKIWWHAIISGIIAAAGIVFIYKVLPMYDIDQFIIQTTETRYRLIWRSLSDFCSNPLFGIGLGNRANMDLYTGRAGTMTWYHMMIPQIIGSLGMLGIFAYGFQMLGRFWLVIKKRSIFVIVLGLSYLGILLMSQVNPGEFCPLPYELLTVILFIFIDSEPDRARKTNAALSDGSSE